MSQRRGDLLAVQSAFCTALFLIPYKAASDHARGPVVLAMLIAAAVFNSLATLGDRADPARRVVTRVSLIAAASLGLFTVLGNLAMAEALIRIDAGLVSVVLQTQVLMVGALAYVAIGERITWRFVAGALVALTGFALVRLADSGDAAVRVDGVLLVLFASLVFAAMHVITRAVIDRVRPLPINAMRLWIAVAGLACVPGAASGLLALPATPWLLAVAAAFFGPFLGRTSVMYAVRYITAARATLFALVTPVFTFLLSFIAFGHTPGLIDLLGAAVILIGVAIPLLEREAT